MLQNFFVKLVVLLFPSDKGGYPWKLLIGAQISSTNRFNSKTSICILLVILSLLHISIFFICDKQYVVHSFTYDDCFEVSINYM